MRVSVDNKDNAPFVYLTVEFAKSLLIHYFTWSSQWACEVGKVVILYEVTEVRRS